ncbi:alpha/beta-hydrolase [Durotheca rogersii]|uniref:alpha/beta-hydrolase n=1 Tax=Durotheca rogersii TaxID=419775 RepID=UPI00221E6316|nr:alpha/beta-hydrolase [Durotheca rogersii]KAI5861684.1 alpha/beta-hydrolase [Durotheca rogersii]
MSEDIAKTEDIRAEDVFEPHLLKTYDPEFVKFMLKIRASSAASASDEFTVEEVRANPARFEPPCAKDTTGYERVTDKVLTSQDGAKFPIKIYHPDPVRFGEGPYGLHLNFHGGGFVLGSLSTESSLCLSMRDGAGVVVIDVDYRLCPETLWGKCMQDAFAAWEWARDSADVLNIKPDSISAGGISAGGHISLVLQHLARDAGMPLKLCLATVPPTSDALTYTHHTDSPFKSFQEFAFGPILPWDRIHFFGRTCLPEGKSEEILATWPEWWISPLKAQNVRGLGDTFIRTGGCDPLRDEGEAYAQKLVEGGNRVTVKRYVGSPHTFPYFGWFHKKQEFDLDTIAALKQAHGVQVK